MILRLSWPDPALWPNRSMGKHWSAKHKAKVAAREAGYFAVKQAKATPDFGTGNIPLSIVFCPPSKVRRDLDGALSACKPMLDGIAQALGVDDSRFCPVVLDRGDVVKGGAVLIGVGVQVG